MTGKTREASPRSDRRGLRFIHGSLAFGAMVLALPIALLGGMALLGTLTENIWIRAAVPGVVLVVIPALLADRLLPDDPNHRKPGLVRDVIAGSWTAIAIAIVALAGPVMAAPLRVEADRLHERGWDRAAYLGRWIAGPEQQEADATAQPAADAPSEQPEQAQPEQAQPELVAAKDASPTTPEQPSDGPEAKPDAAAPTDASKPDAAAPTPEPASAAELREFTPAELFSSYAPAVVSIKVDHGGYSSGGTGFFVDDQGTIATNEHVIAGASSVRVKLFDGTELTRVELLTSNREVDLALLRVDPAQLGDSATVTVLGDSEQVEVGEPVSVIGNPLGLDHTLTNGIVSARRIYEGERYIQMSAPISPGNSGGPVFDRHGRVIGVSVAQMIGGQNLNLAVPVSQLQAMITSEYPNRRSFGASSW